MAVIFTTALGTDGTGDAGFSIRNEVPLTGGAQAQVRASFAAHSTFDFIVDHASIGKSLNNGTGSTAATPVELTFSICRQAAPELSILF
jgi:hypothetical protein